MDQGLCHILNSRHLINFPLELKKEGETSVHTIENDDKKEEVIKDHYL